jgi:hypothetical protein
VGFGDTDGCGRGTYGSGALFSFHELHELTRMDRKYGPRIDTDGASFVGKRERGRGEGVMPASWQ